MHENQGLEKYHPETFGVVGHYTNTAFATTASYAAAQDITIDGRRLTGKKTVHLVNDKAQTVDYTLYVSYNAELTYTEASDYATYSSHYFEEQAETTLAAGDVTVQHSRYSFTEPFAWLMIRVKGSASLNTIVFFHGN